MQVIGGVQRFTAITKLNDMNDVMGRKISTRKCAIYGSGMSRPAVLTLARQHNDVNQVHRVTCFAELAATCRRLLFAHFAEGINDDGEHSPKIPRYNSQAYRGFKQECLTFLVSSQTVSIRCALIR